MKWVYDFGHGSSHACYNTPRRFPLLMSFVVLLLIALRTLSFVRVCSQSRRKLTSRLHPLPQRVPQTVDEFMYVSTSRQPGRFYIFVNIRVFHFLVISSVQCDLNRPVCL
ncbi:hypothetical protein KFU94_12300 [Chloroflexi bacterium TSY]|nr:hypothetical protein [Chloroflexi bacterium TSY]